MSHRLRQMVPAAVLTVAVALGGCGSSEPKPSPSTTTSSAPTAAPTVPIDGPESASITWELAGGANSTDPRIQAVQRYIAYDSYVRALPEKKRDGARGEAVAQGYFPLAMGEQLKQVVANTKGGLRGTQVTGPLWIRLDAPEGNKRSATIVACFDRHAQSNEKESSVAKPGPPVQYTVLDEGGTSKVALIRLPPRDEYPRCQSWDTKAHQED